MRWTKFAVYTNGSSSIKIYKDPRIFIKIENPLSDLYKNHYTASWRPGGHLIFIKITSTFIKISTRIGPATLHSAQSKCDRHSTTSSFWHRRLTTRTSTRRPRSSRGKKRWTPPTCRRCNGDGRGRQRRSASTHAPRCFQRRVLERVIFMKISP